MKPVQVEIHIPLASNEALTEDPFPWIYRVMDMLVNGSIDGGYEMFDDAEEYEGSLVFSIEGPDESALLMRARDVAQAPGVPKGVFAVIRSDHSVDIGVGKRVDLEGRAAD